jgi:Uma2 family endonuclease
MGYVAIIGRRQSISTRPVSTRPVPRLSAEQYLSIERAAEFRSEYLNGEIRAMAGGGVNHAVIAMAAGVQLTEQLKDKDCTVAGSDLRLFCQSANVLTYPDVTVFRGPRKVLDSEKDTITDATVIVEVLSRTTHNYDRGEKFRFYRELPSLSEYVLLAQDAIRAEYHVRQTDGSWLFREFSGVRGCGGTEIDWLPIEAGIAVRTGGV